MSVEKSLLDSLKKKDVKQIKLAVTDIDGVLRGKYISVNKLSSVLSKGAGFCDCIFGWDVNDELYDNAKFTGWHTAFPDAHYYLDLNTQRLIPEEEVPFFLADFSGDIANHENSGNDPFHPVCPRSTLKRVLGKAEQMGFSSRLAFEYEFFLFNETPASIREKNYRDMEPLTPGMFGYSTLRNSTHSELFNELMNYCREFNIPLEGLHCETGPGVWEAALEHDEALSAADKAVLFKTFSKVFFQTRGLMATFMARWSLKYPGQSGHIHQSLFDLKSGKSVFFDEKANGNMSTMMKSYVAGQIKYLKPFLCLAAPTINSYTRLVKGFWAPTASTWGIENRTTALRVIPGGENSQRVEFRVGSADANPYLAAAAVIGAGLLGIEQGLTLEDPLEGNAYEVQDSLSADRQLSSSLAESIVHLENSSEAREIFGKEFTDHFISSRKWEVREYEKAITDWQLQRYFEII